MIDSLQLISIDSEILGIDVWTIGEVSSPMRFQEALAALKLKGRSFYISCKIPVGETGIIHAAERAGFEFIETQFRTSLRIRTEFDTSNYRYNYVHIEARSQLEEVLKIASSTIEHDRFSRDSEIGKQLSGMRYSRLLEESFEREDDEIWCVQSRASGEILTFRSHRKIGEQKVLLLLGGVHPNHKNVGLGVISSHFCFNQLKENGYKQAITHVSAANIPILNLEVGHFGFKVEETYVVLRAIFHPSATYTNTLES